ncbi:MAG TPA: tRNA preQ1(34) S-adenosylmethionine ribosyltransferase-isomerase QueA [Lachnospiraceae bacterium]|nr:tRNA preQ1(34) S-adenosylmethionine ribosyltransferase-isomerase QueA [Lachnospiraceae bacterium]
MKTSDFYYDLPEELIAQDPLKDRSSSRLLFMDRESGEITHGVFTDIRNYLSPGDTLVINDTRVIPARLYGVREGTMGKVEILLLVRKSADTWETLVKPGKKCRIGTKILFGSPDGSPEKAPLIGEVVDILEEGNRLIRFSYEGIFEEVLDSLGEMPLPPYIHHKLEDRTRYNTVYAKHDGSAAAPTAGLHFTKELLEEIQRMGVNIAHVTLHVGLGTFRPVKSDKIEEHHMHSEYYIVSEETAELVNRTRESGHRVICVGTTSCRTIESAAVSDGEGGYKLAAKSGWTQIFIYPGYTFKLMQGLITNFHLPESTLVMLVSAFAGREHVLAAYEEAVKERYRFFSFGDAMLIL